MEARQLFLAWWNWQWLLSGGPLLKAHYAAEDRGYKGFFKPGEPWPEWAFHTPSSTPRVKILHAALPALGHESITVHGIDRWRGLALPERFEGLGARALHDALVGGNWLAWSRQQHDVLEGRIRERRLERDLEKRKGQRREGGSWDPGYYRDPTRD